MGIRLRNRCVAIESLVRPGRMVVLLDEFPQQSLQMALPQDDHMVQKLPAQGSHEPFNERILPWTTVGSTHFLDATGVEELFHAIAIDSVVVEEEKSRLLAVGHGFPW